MIANIDRIMKMFLLLFWVILAQLTFGESVPISCLDQNGNSVDWFYGYKLPSDTGGINAGLNFVYFTSETESKKWIKSERLINDSRSLIGQTIVQGYTEKNLADRFVIAYNDEPPSDSKLMGGKGHTKGMVVGDLSGGFWLIHSVPKYPEIFGDQRNYTYPATGHTYGQSFLCISIPSQQFEVVGKQLMYNEPLIYHSQFPIQFQNGYPTLYGAAINKTIRKAPYWNQINLLSKNNETFVSFAKTKRFGKELYEDWIAPTLGVDLYVETWRHGTGMLTSNCTRMQRVWNVAEIEVDTVGASFNSTKDHSKWAVSHPNDDEKTARDWLCVGDINRAKSQMFRGGGSVCLQSRPVATAYRLIVKDFEPCNSGSH